MLFKQNSMSSNVFVFPIAGSILSRLAAFLLLRISVLRLVSHQEIVPVSCLTDH